MCWELACSLVLEKANIFKRHPHNVLFLFISFFYWCFWLFPPFLFISVVFYDYFIPSFRFGLTFARDDSIFELICIHKLVFKLFYCWISTPRIIIFDMNIWVKIWCCFRRLFVPQEITRNILHDRKFHYGIERYQLDHNASNVNFRFLLHSTTYDCSR